MMEKTLGVMIDCSRNGVLKVDAVKEYAIIPELEEPVLTQDTGINHSVSSCIAVNTDYPQL